MVKILLKAAVLSFIVLSIYLIVHPAACSNFIAGRETVVPGEAVGVRWQHPMSEPQDTLSPATATETKPAPTLSQPSEGVFDTNTLQEGDFQPVYSQQDIDYAIASRYVELEREYAQNHTVGKDASREISFIVMDDFEMSPTEWEDFLTRATAADLFNKIRRDMPQQPSSAQ